MDDKINLVLIFGGKSTEHEVSVKSARSVYLALDKDRYHLIPVGISKEGVWVKGESVQKALETGSPIIDISDRTAILPDPTSQQLISLGQPTSQLTAHNSQLGSGPTVVFPLLHGPLGEDGTIQGLLELANVAYVGCPVLGSSLGMDKVKQKEIFSNYQLPIVNYTFFWKTDWQQDQAQVLNRVGSYFNNHYPLFVKPVNAGSSVGVTKAHNQEELIKGIEEALEFDIKVIVEEGLENIREVEVAVLGNYRPEASVCGEIIPSHEFYDYEAKYKDNTTRLSIPADIDQSTAEKVREIAKKAFLSLDCRGMSRVDFFIEKEGSKFWLNEINTIPGFTEVSMYPKLWEASGLPYHKLIEKLINLALERWTEKQQIKTHFNGN